MVDYGLTVLYTTANLTSCLQVALQLFGVRQLEQGDEEMTKGTTERGRALEASMLVGLAAFALPSMPAFAQSPQGKWNAATDSRIIQGGQNPDQNRWNAVSPWGGIERVAPVEAQQKAPFQIFDNAYYIGFQTVSAYLITTSEGLVLIDSGYEQTVEWLLSSVHQMDFDPADIRYIFVTHAHRDHAGGAAEVKRLTDARVGMSLDDWEYLEQQQFGDAEGQNNPATLARDLVIEDGDAITVGEATFSFYVTPGHTPGATSIAYQVRDGSRVYSALTPGGLGLHYAPDWGPTFKASMERLIALGPWDVMLPNHPFLMPRGLADIEADLRMRGEGSPHPAVLGEHVIEGFFDDVLEIVDRKLVEEPPTGAPFFQ